MGLYSGLFALSQVAAMAEPRQELRRKPNQLEVFSGFSSTLKAKKQKKLTPAAIESNSNGSFYHHSSSSNSSSGSQNTATQAFAVKAPHDFENGKSNSSNVNLISSSPIPQPPSAPMKISHKNEIVIAVLGKAIPLKLDEKPATCFDSSQSFAFGDPQQQQQQQQQQTFPSSQGLSSITSQPRLSPLDQAFSPSSPSSSSSQHGSNHSSSPFVSKNPRASTDTSKGKPPLHPPSDDVEKLLQCNEYEPPSTVLNGVTNLSAASGSLLPALSSSAISNNPIQPSNVDSINNKKNKMSNSSETFVVSSSTIDSDFSSLYAFARKWMLSDSASSFTAAAAAESDISNLPGMTSPDLAIKSKSKNKKLKAKTNEVCLI